MMFLMSASLTMLAHAQPIVRDFFDDLDRFNVAAGSPPIAIDFDDFVLDSNGIDITGLSIEGVTFEAGTDPSAPLIVVRGDDTSTPEDGYWSGAGAIRAE